MSAEQLKERIKDLQELMKLELSSEDVSKVYIADLRDSLADCKCQLAFYTKNPNGVQIVNGV